MQSVLTRDALRPPSPGGSGAGFALSLLVHGGLIVALALALKWHSSEPAGVSAELWAAVRDEPLQDVACRLRGTFVAAAFDRRGNGSVVVDPVAFRCLYIAHTEDALIVSSRAELVARALGTDGGVVRDKTRAAWLAPSPMAIMAITV